MVSLSERYDYEIVFTDNHSTDQSFARICALIRKDNRVRVLRFSRNFGYQLSIFTGYAHARGAAAIQLDCDLQDPPELIPEFVRLWEEGNKVVYGIRRTRQEGWWINNTRKLFYRLITLLSEDTLPHDAGDFRLVDRRLLDELRKTEDRQPYLRGLIAAMGFRQIGVPYDRRERTRGESKFSFLALMHLALDGILNHSVVPLRIATGIGITVSLITMLLSTVYLIIRLTIGEAWPPGFATITILMLISLSTVSLLLGIIGEYLGRIYKQVRKGPRIIVETALNIDRPMIRSTEATD
jgi:dolichol-phosphate mannosyltransferase